MTISQLHLFGKRTMRLFLYRVIRRHVYVPTHFFGEIVKLKSGYEHLKETVNLLTAILYLNSERKILINGCGK